MSVRLSVRRSGPCYFRKTNMAVFECEKSSNDIINNESMSDDEVVASYVPPRYLFLSIIFPWALLLISKKRREKMETYEHNREEKCIRTKNTERKKRVRASKDACKKYRSLLRKLLPKNLANTPICSHSSINSFVRSFIYLSIHSLISFYSSVCMYVHLYESICICL